LFPALFRFQSAPTRSNFDFFIFAVMPHSISGIYDHRKTKDWFWLGLICVACSLLMLAFPILGIPDGYDVAQHLRFAAAYQDAILDGSFVPVWASIDNLGFGSVGVRFYPPFADYILAITQIFTNDWYQTLWINSFFWMFPGCIGVYFWVKEFRPPMHAAVAAILYAIMPYHLLQIYQFQLYSEFVASAILPFCFLFATKLIKRGSTVDVLGLAVSCSLLLLTHIPSSMIGFAGLGLYVAFMIDWKSPLKTIGRFAVATALALTAASFYLIRLITEVDWVKHSTAEFSTGFYDHRRHFFPIIYNFGDWYWQRMLWLLDLPIILTLLILLPLIFCVVRPRNFGAAGRLERKMLIAVSVTGLFSIFMLSMISGFVWNTVTILQKIQFPWRFLSVASLMGAVSLTLAVSLLLDRYRRFSRLIIYSTTALILGTFLFDLTQTILTAAPLTREKFYEMVVNKREEEACTCWWPTWAERGALENHEHITASDRSVNILTWKGDSRSFIVDKGLPSTAQLATFYYPYWKATINGVPAPVEKDANGAMSIALPPDRAEVNVFFEEPAPLLAAKYLSIFAWLSLLAAFPSTLLLAKKRRITSPTLEPIKTEFPTAVAVGND
jgi:hypothetical protein